MRPFEDELVLFSAAVLAAAAGASLFFQIRLFLTVCAR